MRKRRKKKRDRNDDDELSEERKSIAEQVLSDIYHHFKFPLDLFKYTEEEDGSYCTRTRTAFLLVNLRFNHVI